MRTVCSVVILASIRIASHGARWNSTNISHKLRKRLDVVFLICRKSREKPTSGATTRVILLKISRADAWLVRLV